MKKTNTQTNNVILTTLSIITLLVAIIGASIAYFSVVSETNQQIKTGELMISSVTGSVVGKNIEPILSSELNEPWVSDNKNISTIQNNKDIIKLNVNVDTSGTTLTTNNTDKVIADLDLYLMAIAGWGEAEYTNGVPSDIKWKLVESDTGKEINSGEFNQLFSEIKLTNNTNPLSITSDVTSYDYTLLIYVLENHKDQTDLQGLKLSAKVRAEVKQNIGI